jgi:phosphotransferase system HPr (HPr) family protein
VTGGDTHETTVTVRNKSGLHARPSSLIAETALRFRDTELTVSKGDQTVDAKSIMELLLLAAGCGTELTIRGKGPEARQGVAAIEELFARHFNLPF